MHQVLHTLAFSQLFSVLVLLLSRHLLLSKEGMWYIPPALIAMAWALSSAKHLVNSEDCFFSCGLFWSLHWSNLFLLAFLWTAGVSQCSHCSESRSHAGFYTGWLHKCITIRRGVHLFLLLVLFAPVGWCSFCHHILLWFDSKHFLLFIRPFFKLLLKTQETTCKYTNSNKGGCLHVS